MSDSESVSPLGQSASPKTILACSPQAQQGPSEADCDTTFPVCPVCGGELVDIRHKLICSRCHTICETCCEGGRG